MAIGEYSIDHLGNVFESQRKMCEHWNIPAYAYRDRIKKGYSVEQALTIPYKKSERDSRNAEDTYIDHMGNKFRTLRDMCEYWGVNSTTYASRIKSGCSIEEALTKQKNGYIEDHLGNKFNNIEEMCKHWGVSKRAYQSRIEKGWSLKDALKNSDERRVVAVDHLGNKYSSLDDMCKHWGINLNIYYRRKSKGMDLSEILETGRLVAENDGYMDHLGNVFRSKGEMCRHWGVSYAVFKQRINKGMSLEEALKKSDVKVRDQITVDHLGHHFKSENELCEYWGISRYKLIEQLKSGFELKDILEQAKVNRSKNVCKDHLNNEFESVREMCNHWGINYNILYNRIKSGYRLKDALETPIRSEMTKVKDHLGKEYDTFKEMCEHWNISHSIVKARLNRNWSLKDALEMGVGTRLLNKSSEINTILGSFESIIDTARCTGQSFSSVHKGLKISKLDIDIVVLKRKNRENIVMDYIGIDGKAYYKVWWSPDPVTARQIVEHYRPDLLQRYDELNSQGLYRPYQGVV